MHHPAKAVIIIDWIVLRAAIVRKRHVMTQEFKTRVAPMMKRDIALGARVEVVDAQHVVALR